MRKTAIIAWLLLLLPYSFAMQANVSSGSISTTYPSLNIIVLKYEPFPAEPGSYVDLWIKIENKGSLDAEMASFTLKPSYPFSLDASETAQRDFGIVGPHSAVIAKYKVRIDANAIEGTYPVSYEYKTKTNQNPIESSFDVSVQTIDAILAIESVKSDPERIAPGEVSKIIIKFKNTADSYIKYLSVMLNLVAQLQSATGTTVVELPFTPVGEGNSKTIYQLAGGEERELSFNVVANPDADSRPYKIPLSINYYDSLGNLYNKTQIVGIIIGSEPELDAQIESSEIYGKNQPGDIGIRIINKGVTNVKFLSVKINQSKDYKILSSDKQYIGKIDSDDYELVKFKLSINKIPDGRLDLPITIEYSDANNAKYSKNMIVSLYVYSKQELGLAGSGLSTLILAVIVIAGSYLAYKKWVKRTKK